MIDQRDVAFDDVVVLIEVLARYNPKLIQEPYCSRDAEQMASSIPWVKGEGSGKVPMSFLPAKEGRHRPNPAFAFDIIAGRTIYASQRFRDGGSHPGQR
jgi:hypothetical protein